MDQVTDEYQEIQDSMRKGWIELFHEFANKKGELRRKEIIELMRVCRTDPTDREVDEYIKEIDKNGDMIIDCEEFCSFMEKQTQKGDPIQRLRDAFDYYDKDKSGFIDRHELKDILKDCGEDPNDKKLLDLVIESTDTNKDGKIDIREFVNKLHNV